VGTMLEESLSSFIYTFISFTSTTCSVPNRVLRDALQLQLDKGNYLITNRTLQLMIIELPGQLPNYEISPSRAKQISEQLMVYFGVIPVALELDPVSFRNNVPEPFSTTQLEALQLVFARFDCGANGQIDTYEVGSLMEYVLGYFIYGPVE
jgi:hypothetical protein